MESNMEEKAIVEVTEESGETHMRWLPSGITSFADYDQMEVAKQQALKVKNDAEIFKGIIDNILEMEPEEGLDKSSLIIHVAGEFSARVGTPMENEPAINVKDHYKEVAEFAEKATDDDFQGGCPSCGFGEKELLKEKCPYCGMELDE